MTKTRLRIYADVRPAPTPLDASITVSAFLDLYEQEYLPHQAVTTQRQKRGFFPVIRKSLGTVPLEQLTPERLREWRDQLIQRLALSSVWRYMHILSSVLQVAVRDYEWLPRNPMHRVKKPSLPPQRVRYLDPDEQKRLLEACQHSRTKALYPVVLLALTSGMRRDEMLTLRWTELDLGQGMVRLKVTKTGQRRAVPLPQMTVLALLEWQLNQNPPSMYVFPSRDGTKPANLARAQVDNFRFHDLRHSAASYLAMAGVRIEVIADILGHKSIQTTRRYAHLSTSYAQGFVEKMAQEFIQLSPTQRDAHAEAILADAQTGTPAQQVLMGTNGYSHCPPVE